MPKLSWFLVPMTALCWWHAYNLYQQANRPLATDGQFDDLDDSPIPSDDLHHNNNNNNNYSYNDTSTNMIMGDTSDNLFYFIQVSDIHISVYRRQSTEHLRRFLNTTLPIVRPQFVLVTGDLTDAKDSWKISSAQIRQEWVDYRSLLDEYGISQRKEFWWDQRGNHDCFNVPNWQSRENYFKELSVVGDEQYSFQYSATFGNYSFIALDACRPFNFFGYFDSNDMNFLERRLRFYSRNGRGSNHTFLLSHYPIGTTLMGYTTDGKSFGELSRHVSVFLSGHLHKLAGGLGNILHAHHPENLLELEIADLKQHGNFRVIAIDHDLISFVDSSVLPTQRLKELRQHRHLVFSGKAKTTKNTTAASQAEYDLIDSNATLSAELSGEPEPLVLITNPKDARYTIKRHEPIGRIRRSTHIRFLVFTARTIARIQLTIDGERPGNANQRGPYPAGKLSAADIKNSTVESPPLYVYQWNPGDYDDGHSHLLLIQVWDDRGQRGEHSVLFRVDGKRPPLNIGIGELILTARYSLIFKWMFVLAYLTITIGLLLGPKLISAYLHKTHRYHRWRLAYSRQLVARDRAKPIALPTGPGKRWERWRMVWRLRLRLIVEDFRFFIQASAFRLVTLASLPSTFYPLYLFTLYITIGPFFVGELVPTAVQPQRPLFDRFGAFYLYGMYIEHRWMPMMDTWLFGMLEVLYILGPLVVYLSFSITPPEQLYSRPPPTEELLRYTAKTHYYFPPVHDRRRYPLHRRPMVRLIVSGSVLFQLVNVFFIGLYYGPWAMVLSPGKTWFIIWAIWALWRHRWSELGREVDLLELDRQQQSGNKKKFSAAREVISNIGKTVVNVASSPARIIRTRRQQLQDKPRSK